MKVLSLKSTKRENFGKSHARVLRRSGEIPAVLYGSDSVLHLKLSVKASDLYKIIRSSKTSHFLLDLNVDGKVKKVTIKELQKHTILSEILHVDFYEVNMTSKIKVNVPITTIGKSIGVELGGMLQLVRHNIEVFCLPDKIPSSIVVDITNLNIGESFHARDLIISDDVDIVDKNNFTLLTVLSQKAPEIEESIEEDEEEDIDESNEDDEIN